MARTGLYKSDVKKARNALLAQNTHPSVDAVRVALGNTGSKTTIHKYLKELDEESGGADGRKTSISEALQDLVARLAVQLQDEANLRIDAIQAQSAEKERQHAEAMAALRKEVEALSSQLQRTETAAHQETAEHGRIREALQAEMIARHTAEQQVADLKERLAENEAHRQSIEEKHKHAREALEHYRQSVKDQRDQDQRRHEQQIQQLQAEIRLLQQSLVVKQDEVTRLNQEGARLVADLSYAQKALYDQQSHGRQLEQKLEILRPIEQRCKTVEAQLVEKDTHIKELKRQAADALKQAAEFSQQVHRLELELTTAQAKLDAQQVATEQLRAYMERQGASEKMSPR
ncbi:DNA-binding protein [Collimonas antrihumi]|uniref:DNA-binding protein n=1 Tax=Collimonas antrihumi TaxID=1940615 RepID=UPI001B8AC5E2|nr:DNA-binding protein [Collimonas antrihumi]